MAPSTPSTPHGRHGSESGSPAPTFAAPGTYTLEDVVPGVKIFVLKPLPSGQSEQRKAEILSTRARPVSAFAPVPAPGEAGPDPRDDTEYYVHYVEFNKRLDEWVGGSRLVTEKELEWPKPKEEEKKKARPGSGTGERGTPGSASGVGTPLGRKGTPTPGSLLKKAANKAAAAAAAAAAGQGNKTVPTGKDASSSKSKSKNRKIRAESSEVKMEIDEDGTEDGDDEDAEGSADGDVSMKTDSPEGGTTVDGEGEIDLTVPTDPKAGPRVFSKKQEIEKLRTSGSMTQAHSEVSRVKNFNKLSIGQHIVESWYFSPYPADFAHLPILYICEFCLQWYHSAFSLKRHRTKCTLVHPPGNEIYRHEGISFFELDGRRQRAWCRNLCLLSKCFLDHKTLYYDVDPFMYYCMTVQDEWGKHLIGYFSKEKESAENYNVACILTLPQHQRKGYGRLLIEFSYELSKREGKTGSPEKPLSDLGLLGYRAYWQEKIVQYLLDNGQDETTVDEIAHTLAITPGDIMQTCRALHMLKYYKGNHIIHLTQAISEQHEKTMKKQRQSINPAGLDWKPPVFSRAQLAFGF